MALLSDMVPIRGTKGLGGVKEWGSDGVGQIWQRKQKWNCPSWTGKGDREQESRAKRRERGLNEGRCVFVGED